MKILHITDSHGTVRNPIGRRDMYYVSFLKKMYELGIIIKKENIDLAIHTGDLFHTPRVSDKFAGQVAEIIRGWGIPIYIVPGNHDIDGYNIKTIEQTKLGLLNKTGNVELLTREDPVFIKTNDFTVSIAGQEYYADVDSNNADDFMMNTTFGDINILAAHAYLTDKPQNPNIKHILCKDITTDADIILAGHYHNRFEYDGGDFQVFNPGSMMRIEQSEYNKTNKPMYGILEITTDDAGDVEYDYTMREFVCALPSTVVFDYDKKYAAKAFNVDMEAFKKQLGASMSVVSSVSLKNALDQTLKAMNPPPTELVPVINQAINAAKKKTADADSFGEQNVKPQQKYIKSIDIMNFQSHENTHIDFDKGVNVIIGEGNNGKSAILRAIMWVIDNTPGSDFIMTGKDKCSVTITYNDGTSICRRRTKSSSGEYVLDNGSVNVLKGFGSSVPLDVKIMHQMPKIDICGRQMHLNVISQFDEPFLLAGSPAEKATAIGKITGVDIIDAAITDCRKKVRDANQSIKTYVASKAEKQKELSACPDLAVYEVTMVYAEKIIDALEKHIALREKLESLLERYSNATNGIEAAERELKESKKYINLKRYADLMQKEINKSYMTAHKLNEFSDMQNRINQCQNTLRQEKIKSICFLAAKSVQGSVQKMHSIMTLKTEYENICNNAASAENVIKIWKNNPSRTVAVFTENKIRDVLKVLELKNKAASLRLQKEEKFNSTVSLRQEIKRHKDKIKELDAKQIQIIHENGICPCCQQKISEEAAASHVLKFLSNGGRI